MTTDIPFNSRKHNGKAYWGANALVDDAMTLFLQAVEAGDRNTIRNNFYRLTRYYARTLLLLRQSTGDRKEPLAVAA